MAQTAREPIETVEATALESGARALAQEHCDLERPRARRWRSADSSLDLRLFGAALAQAERHLSSSDIEDAAVLRAAEWFLDNYYLVRRVARQVAEELPRGFVRRLPQLASGRAKGFRRIDVLAREVILRSGIDPDREELLQFIHAYQEVSPLTIAELWALPTMLRAAVLRGLLTFLNRLLGPSRSSALASQQDVETTATLQPNLGVERSIRALRVLADLDWKMFFEATNHVEARLREDPANVYARMDFQTCDAYRRAVEELAWASNVSEVEVANRAVLLAKQAAHDPRRGHVGYYLVGSGRSTLEAQIGYRAAGLERIRRTLSRHPMLTYFVPLVLGTAAMLGTIWALLLWPGQGAFLKALVAGATIAPLWSVALATLQSLLARLLPPRVLPKLNFTGGIQEDARTLVVIPTLLGRFEDIEEMLRQIERHYLANPDPRLGFALLTDDVDSLDAPTDNGLFDRAAEGITRLNEKHGNARHKPFHLLHRKPHWNPSEGRYMGWERKRGKLEELNHLLRGDRDTSFVGRVGDPAQLKDIRFVITLDSDTELPMESAHRLVGLLAHPLNRAVFDEQTGRVVSGYSIVQPRVETSPSGDPPTKFGRILAGDVGFDIYAHASSELYQDLFGSGIYCGKGIYDVDAFMRSLDGRVPENSLASHDLFEGVHGRTALASDIVLFEQHPQHYATYARRMHRWVRGDWQLLPWLLPRVPSATGAPIANPLAPIDRWKIADNLRRSLVAPSLCILLVAGWTFLPASPLASTLLALAILLAPALPAIAKRPKRWEDVARSVLPVVFLLHEATVVLDAVVRVLVRMLITRRHLLQWTSAAQAELGVAGRSSRALLWRDMWPAQLLSLAIAAIVLWLRAPALAVAAPLLAVWMIAPEIARWLSAPSPSDEKSLGAVDRKQLRMLASRTWLFFETFVGPVDQWLPIDNYQEAPREQTAHRTSPTNIGMMLLSTLSAFDFGYIGPDELALRLRRAFDSIARMAHYQGHLLNWYDTKSLQPLLPQYVSTVDSGNFAGCLVALKRGCADAAEAHVLRPERWRGLEDTLNLVHEIVSSLVSRVEPGRHVSSAGLFAGSVYAALRGMRAHVERGREASLADGYAVLVAVFENSAALDRELRALLQTGAYRHEADLLHSLRATMGRLHQQLQHMRDEAETLVPWLGLGEEPPARALRLPARLRLRDIPEESRRLQMDLDTMEHECRARGELTEDWERSAARLREAFQSAQARATDLCTELTDLGARADAEARGMDFRLLFDTARKLFHIGFNVTIDQVDPHFYDLLASEARLASYIAIVKRDVPESHWYALGRPMTRVFGAPALLSWGGTMFEYLMPSLLMRSREGTLIAQSAALAVKAQIAYGRAKRTPWGISESAYARVDAQQTYQYRSFGVPGLGFKRDLEDDLVVAPYASVLALSHQPRAVVDNIARLEQAGMLGAYGLYEALDLHPERSAEGPARAPAVVRSYMAHHQGMLLVALNNLLNDQIMVDRFHADARVRAGEVLLNERAPVIAPAEWPLVEGTEGVLHVQSSAPRAPAPWSPDEGRPQAILLSNGRLSTLLTDRGAGGLRWHNLAVTRYEPDVACDGDGIWIYLSDEESNRTWVALSDRIQATFSAHKAEFHHREDGISVRVHVGVSPTDDVELRLITLHNETERPRHLTVTTAAEPVLLALDHAAAHPAFGRMFLVSEHVAALDAIVFTRRPRSEAEERAVLVHRLVRNDTAVKFAGYETDRGAFFGRCRGRGAPRSLSSERRSQRGQVGAVIDPIMTLTARVTLKPKAAATLAFVTVVARTRSAALATAQRYGSMTAVEWAFRDSEQDSARRLARIGVAPELVPAVHRLFSALHFADPTFRKMPEGNGGPDADGSAARPRKEALWGRGISGDFPILLLHVGDVNASLLREAVLAHRYLRSCGFAFDLLLIDEEPSGYATDSAGTLRSALAQLQAAEWINKRGGVYLLSMDQIGEEEYGRLASLARMVLDTRDGSLDVCMNRRRQAPPKLPRFSATLLEDAPPLVPSRPRLAFDNGFGGVTEDGREYVIAVRPGQPTPAPWCNVLANPDFGCITSESSLGCTWSLNASENRLTPWRNDPVFDTPSEVLYLRDEETAAVWSSTPLPAGGDAETQVVHGAGYTRYLRESHGLQEELTVFVPPGAPLKVARLRLRNKLPRHRRLTATYYAEWVFGSLREGQRAYVESSFDRTHTCLLATCPYNAAFGDRVAFLASELDVHGFTVDRVEFLGRPGDYAQPEALARWGLSGRIEPTADPCAALQAHLELDGVGSGRDEIVTHFVLGQAPSRTEALALVARFRDAKAVSAAWDALATFWDDLLGTIRVRTPEPAMDVMLNRWLLYQCVTARVFGRTGFYQSSGALGYRDQLQDVLALVHAAPERVRAHLLEAAAHQFEEGDVLHWWHPPSGRGVRTRCSDDMVWLSYVTANYVSATGDASVLGERVPFLAGEPLRMDEHDRYAEFARSTDAGTLLEHCRRALHRALTQGRHGLPLMGDGDWNDGMNKVGAEGKGESVWLAWFLCTAMNSFATMCERLQGAQGKDSKMEAASWRSRAEELRSKIEACAWDGRWYLRAFHDDGSVVGSQADRECCIDSIAQSWAVLSGVADESRARAAIRAADERLVREERRLVLLLAPPFDTTPHDPGYIRAYPPGVRENGGQYTHAATWLGWAHATLADGRSATRIFRLLNPLLRAGRRADCEHYRVEPYVLAGDVYGCRPWEGRGGWTWYTGAAGWAYRLGIEGILGLRKEDGKLRIDPCIPPEWGGFEAWVRFEGEEIHVAVENPSGVSRGVVAVTLDGVPLDSNLIRLPPRSKPAERPIGAREVRVVLGESRMSRRAPLDEARQHQLGSR